MLCRSPRLKTDRFGLCALSGQNEVRVDVADSRVEMIRLLIEHGADPNRKGAGAYAAEPIFHCFFADEVRVLLDAGANIDVRQRPL